MNSRVATERNEINNWLTELCSTSCKPFIACNKVADYASDLISRQELKPARRIMQRLAEIYTNSRTNLIRTAIENVFIYRIGGTILLSAERDKLIELIPLHFRDGVLQQMKVFAM